MCFFVLLFVFFVCLWSLSVCDYSFVFVCLFVLMILEECAGAVAMHLGTLMLD